MSSNYLQIAYLNEHFQDKITISKLECRNLPFSNSEVILAPIEKVQILTHGDEVKRVYDLKLSIKDSSHDFLPGDTIGILPSNNVGEVNELLIRLNIESVADKVYKLGILKDTTKKNAAIPKHIPNCETLRNLFLNYVDIRSPPKKLFIKSIARFAVDVQENEKLVELLSPKSSQQYLDLISGNGRTLLGFLNVFPSCLPPVEIILEHLPPLQPRPYSIASSPLLDNFLHVTFFVLDFENGQKGVCTGWLENLIKSACEGTKLPIYFRQPNNFRFPSNNSLPLIMIAGGTGLAPFQGFLQHRSLLLRNSGQKLENALLFYGCRYADKDFLFKSDIHTYLKTGVLTKLHTAFSRESAKKCYVQHKLKEHGQEFFDYVINKNAIIFVCGDAKTFVKGIKGAIVKVLVEFGGLDVVIAEETLTKFEKEGRYLVDSWT